MSREPGSVSSELSWTGEERLRSALDGLLEGVNIFDAEVRYRYANPSALTQGRVRLEQVLGKRMIDVFPGVERTEFYEVLAGICAGAPQQRIKTPFQFQNGEVGYFELFIEPLSGGGAFLLSVDTTAQVLAEQKLAESDARHRALLGGIPDLVFLLDSQGTVLDLHAPPSFPLLQPRDALLGRPLAASLPDALVPLTLDALHRARTSRRPVSVQYEVPLVDGVHHFDATIVLGEQDHFTLVVRDVTERVQLEAQLKQAQKMEAIGQLTGGIAHDFNNVLAVIGGNAELMATLSHEAGDSVAPEIEEIIRATRRGADMVAQLLQFSRRGVLRRQPADPAAVIGRAGAMLRRLLPETVQLQVDAMPEGHVLLLDTGALEQIIANLCTNARDAMPNGGLITISGAIVTTAEWSAIAGPSPDTAPLDSAPHYLIAVRDTGVGMDERTRRQVFEPFFTTKPVGVGTGLGLSMVYGLMRSHGGSVMLESAPGAGTIVRLYFPLATVSLGADAERIAPPSPRPPTGHEGILLVEDDAAIRKATQRALESKGYRVLEAADGVQALETFERHAGEISLVITDLVMPNLGGRELAEALRARGSAVPVLFTSGYAADGLFGDADIPAGVQFLQKPWTLAELFTHVRDAIDAVSPRDRPEPTASPPPRA
jgi:signal transduction histidine kinase/ActR/RegA family two-component response regulator